eukprot:1175481-Amphidinium_carterae.1
MLEVYLLTPRPQSLDARTVVPHLLIIIRSLGFVEIQGKNTGQLATCVKSVLETGKTHPNGFYV